MNQNTKSMTACEICGAPTPEDQLMCDKDLGLLGCRDCRKGMCDGGKILAKLGVMGMYHGPCPDNSPVEGGAK